MAKRGAGAAACRYRGQLHSWLDGARAIAQTLVDAQAALTDPVVGRITVSAGVSTLRGADDTAQRLLRRGDEALYEAKGQGRNRVVVQG